MTINMSNIYMQLKVISLLLCSYDSCSRYDLEVSILKVDAWKKHIGVQKALMKVQRWPTFIQQWKAVGIFTFTSSCHIYFCLNQ